MQTRPVVSVIIVSYNTREMTLDCLRALYADLAGLDSEVWVVDNASTDGSPAAIRAAFPAVHLLENSRNVGFGIANNQAMARAGGEFFLLLNTDAFPKPGAVGSLVAYLRAHPDTAIAGPRLLNADGSLQISCFPFPSPSRAWLENLWISTALPNHPVVGDYRRWPHDRERQVDTVIGACMLVRRTAYEQVGGFDENFFMYTEEIEWQRRLRDRNWQIAFTPTAQVTHLGGASGATEAARINRHFFDSLDYYEWKHHGLAGLISLRLAMTIGCFLRSILWTLVLVAVPRRRPLARSKARLQAWLTVRQATHWRLDLRGRAQC
ncbi:MAG: glycosyltransferase family 2 protein [Armatimonadetes bacterium]|nr:glycosyltransferase family 2 protein [Armatimonadota bacterium]